MSRENIVVASRKLGHFFLESELGEWEEKLSKEVKAPFDGAPWVTCFQGQAGGLQPLFRGAPAAGWDNVVVCILQRWRAGLEAVWGHSPALQGEYGLVAQRIVINYPKKELSLCPEGTGCVPKADPRTQVEEGPCM